MARRAWIPSELMQRPFSLDEARRAGLSRELLRGKAWRRIGRGLYAYAGLPDDPWKLLHGWVRMLPPEAVFAGVTAAWLHGLDFDPIHPIEVIVPPDSQARSRAGLTVRHRYDIEAAVVRGLRVSTVHRTLSDLSLRLSAVETLIALDAALKAGLVDRASLLACTRLRRLGELAMPAESPMETRLRWLLLEAGLPVPEVQTDLHDAHGRFVGRADLHYRMARLVIEYDGGNHRDRLVEDNRRQNALINAGYRVLRFTASDIYNRVETVEALVRSALDARPGGRVRGPDTSTLRKAGQSTERYASGLRKTGG